MPDDRHDGADPAATAARLDADEAHRQFLHRAVRCRLRRGESPAEIRSGSAAVTAKVAQQNTSWTPGEQLAYINWHADAVERSISAPLTEEN